MPCRAMAAICRRQDWSCPLGSPFGPSEKGIMVWRSSCERRRIRACRPHAARAEGAALDRPCAAARLARPRLEPARGARALPGCESVRGLTPPARGPDAPGRGLSRARRQPRLADASRRFAVAGARVDRCARLRRHAFMGFDAPIRPFGPDIRVEAHKTQEPSRIRTDMQWTLDKPVPIRARP
jgi:hypothetical protein